jgi:hypothetical protein
MFTCNLNGMEILQLIIRILKYGLPIDHLSDTKVNIMSPIGLRFWGVKLSPEGRKIFFQGSFPASADIQEHSDINSYNIDDSGIAKHTSSSATAESL